MLEREDSQCRGSQQSHDQLQWDHSNQFRTRSACMTSYMYMCMDHVYSELNSMPCAELNVHNTDWVTQCMAGTISCKLLIIPSYIKVNENN